jgi:hypothetical protein
MVVKAINPRNLGKVVRVLVFLPQQAWEHPEGVRIADGWTLEAETTSWSGGSIDRAPDWCLRPIRDPGDDARDQTLDWLQVPTKEHA